LDDFIILLWSRRSEELVLLQKLTGFSQAFLILSLFTWLISLTITSLTITSLSMFNPSIPDCSKR
jgi:hypothetical protein